MVVAGVALGLDKRHIVGIVVVLLDMHVDLIVCTEMRISCIVQMLEVARCLLAC